MHYEFSLVQEVGCRCGQDCGQRSACPIRDLGGDPPLLSLHHALSASRGDNSTVSIGQVVLILLGLGHRAREDKAADLQVKLVRIRQEVNGTQRLLLTG
jgi:hypothetical protein